MSADRQMIRVYHTPEIQSKVAEVIDRFVAADSSSQAVSVRLVTVHQAAWRTMAWPVMSPIRVSSNSIEAWVLEKEDASVLLAKLRTKPDYREHNSANLMIRSGQSDVIERKLPRDYIKGIERTNSATAVARVQRGQIKEGFSLRISPLATLDGSMIDVVIKCHVDQIERMTPVTFEVPHAGSIQRIRAEIPQLSSWRLHERFRWPSDKVLLISRGLVAMPGLRRATLPGISELSGGKPSRADALLFLTSEPIDGEGLSEKRVDFQAGRLNYRGRY